jgi:colicin import membrane protein
MAPKLSPKDKAAEKAMQNEAEKSAKAQAQKEKEEATIWSMGAKSNAKAKEAEEKDAEKRQKAAEKAQLLAEEEAALGSIVRAGKPTKKAGKDDFDLLNAALKNQPKTKAQKEAEAKKKATDERLKKEAEARELKLQKQKV